MNGNGHVKLKSKYAKANGIPVPADLDNLYSIDMNLWGRAIEAGILEKSME